MGPDDERAVTPVISVILLVVVAVIIVGVVGNAIVTGITPDSEPDALADVDVQLTDDTVTIAHLGGQMIPLADLRVYVRNSSTTEVYDPTTANLSDATDATLHPGETWSRNHSVGLVGDERLEAILVHRPSGSVLARQTVSQASLGT